MEKWPISVTAAESMIWSNWVDYEEMNYIWRRCRWKEEGRESALRWVLMGAWFWMFFSDLQLLNFKIVRGVGGGSLHFRASQPFKKHLHILPRAILGEREGIITVPYLTKNWVNHLHSQWWTEQDSKFLTTIPMCFSSPHQKVSVHQSVCSPMPMTFSFSRR